MKQAEYLRDELQRLRQIASNEDLKTLAYLLEVAEREANVVFRMKRQLALALQARQVARRPGAEVQEG
ncbi:hypothetical protein GCM10007301_40830 [Azorhizobium oxalatiphilum]|uniref:Uncharacterized protein n=2 Tax=Azorhizobium oxalatiphilum TaxID=980631 RepID=A0A917FH01_9HYPH|nr:hypothetical protein GCM10007301_40830 [Azorhizobium oxalatiphilum]